MACQWIYLFAALALLSVADVLFGMKCYHLHEGCLASFGRVVVLLEGRGSIDIDLDYCWAEAGVGWLWICAGGQAVSASSGGEACEGVLVYGGAVVYGMEDQQCDGVVQSELLCGVRQGGCGCEGEGAFDVQGRDEALSASEVGGVYRWHCGVSWRTVGLDVC